MIRERELIDKGFEKRTVYDEPRLSEIVSMYEEMGFEVVLAPFNPDEVPGCAECMTRDPSRYKVVYTRLKEK
ncbi:MAG: hypothetical protein QNJ97_03120 [Myxococcota bacterium]|nr:hypothetical protein [Myxococcota bacterium]